MNEDVIEHYDTISTKGCPYKLMFGNLHDQPIPPNYYNFLNDDDDEGNNIPCTLADDDTPDNI